MSKISAYTLATLAELTDDDLIVLVNSPASSPAMRKVTLALLKGYMGDSLGNQSTSDQAMAAAATAYVVGSALTIPPEKLRIGTIIKWRLTLTKTAAGIAARSFLVKLGTAGTTADATVLTFSVGAGTAVADTAHVEITVVVRGPLSASGILQGECAFSHELASTGFHTKAGSVVQVTSGSVDVTAANLIIGLTITAGASEVITIKQCIAEAKGL